MNFFTTNRHCGTDGFLLKSLWLWLWVLSRTLPSKDWHHHYHHHPTTPIQLRRTRFYEKPTVCYWNTFAVSRCIQTTDTFFFQLGKVRQAEQHWFCSAQSTYVSPRCILAPKVYRGRVYPSRKPQTFCACELDGFTGSHSTVPHILQRGPSPQSASLNIRQKGHRNYLTTQGGKATDGGEKEKGRNKGFRNESPPCWVFWGGKGASVFFTLGTFIWGRAVFPLRWRLAAPLRNQVIPVATALWACAILTF